MFSPPTRVCILTFIALSIAAIGAPAARARDNRAAAKTEFEKATAAYGLGNYADAASHYEKAFELKADQALLYNAAQAHRLAGNKERAIQLYRNYLRVYARGARREDASRHLETLEKAVAAERARPVEPGPRAVDPPPTSAPAAVAASATPPPPVTIAPVAALPVPESASPPAVNLSAAPSPDPGADTGRPLLSRPWFWVAAGVAVAALAVGAALVASSPRTTFPAPSLGNLR